MTGKSSMYTMEKEIWKEYSEKELRSKFLISNYGNVRSIPRNSPDKPITLKGYKNAGYPAIPTRLVNGKNTLRYVHKLVALLFVPNPHGYTKLVYKDNNKENVHATNLEWVDNKTFAAYHKAAVQRKYTYPKGVVRNAKLTEGQVRLLRKKLNDPNRKTRHKILAKQFGIAIRTLYAIKSGENWKHVK